MSKRDSRGNMKPLKSRQSARQASKRQAKINRRNDAVIARADMTIGRTLRRAFLPLRRTDQN